MVKHASEVKAGGGKAIKTELHKLLGGIEVKMRAKGYKSSEGDKEFSPPDDVSLPREDKKGTKDG